MSARKSRARKAALIVLEIVGAALAAVAGLAAFVAWRIQSGPVSLSALRSSAEFAVERALPKGHDATLGALFLSRGEGRGEFRLTIADATVIRNAAAVVALPKVVAVFNTADLAKGGFGPRILEFEKPVISFTRVDGVIKADAAGFGDFDLIRLLNDRKWLKDSFESAEFRDARVIYADKASGRTWRSEGASASLDRTLEGFDAEVAGRFDIDGKPASLSLTASYAEKRRAIEAALKVVEAPVGDILGMFYGDSAAVLEAPVTGVAKVKMTDKGAVLASTVDLKSGAGLARVGAKRFAVDFVTLKTDFDPVANAFDNLKFAFAAGPSEGSVAGRVVLQPAEDKRSLRRIEFALASDELTLAPKDVFAEPFRFEKLAAQGSYDIAARSLTIASADAEFLDVALKGTAEMIRAPKGAGESPALKADFAMEGSLDPVRIARGWPLKLAPSVREFIATRLPAARVDNLNLHVDFAQGALGKGKFLPDEALSLTFDIADATAVYTPGMTPISGASGKATLSGNKFVIAGIEGKVGGVLATKGSVEFTQLAPKGAPVNYSFTAQGSAREFLRTLNQPPLSILKKTNLAPEQFSGSARGAVVITRPNLRLADQSSYKYAGKLSFEQVSIADFFRGGDLEGATGTIDLRSRDMRIVADAKFGGAPVTIDWRQRFYEQDGPSNFNVEGTIDSSTGDVFGVPTRAMLRGPVDFKAAAVGDLSAIRSLSLEADFTKAALTLDALDWHKSAGLSAKGKVTAAFARDQIVIDSVSLEGDDIAVRGSGAFGPAGALNEARFDRFYLGGAADLTLDAERTEAGALTVDVSGAFLNAGPLLEKMIASPKDPQRPDAWKNGLQVTGKLNEAILRGEARVRNASLDFRRRGKILEALSFTATTSEDKPVSVLMTPATGTAPELIEAKSGDLGVLFAGFFGVTSIRGGEGAITMTTRADGERRAVEGAAEARGMRVVKAPLLARLFAAGSFTGLSDLLNGEGIELAKAKADFSFKDGVVSIRNARATGPSIGITAEGEINARKEGAVALQGAVAPAYQLNSFLGKAPLVGDILINRKGEGLMALSYSVSGPTAQPTVTVNPLSALTPGVLRRMFEGRDAVEAEPAGQ